MHNIEKYNDDFIKIYEIIASTKENVWYGVNSAMIKLYWTIGQFVSNKVKNDGWGKNVVEGLSEYILSRDTSSKGFSARNIWRMKQFYETYEKNTELSAVLTEISWSNHLHVLTKTKLMEEKVFYLNLAAKNHYSERNFAKLIDSGTFERTALSDKKLSALLTVLPRGVFKDPYIFDFVELPENHDEKDLKAGLLGNLKRFLLEFGHDFSLIGEEYTVQVGMKDFKIDLLLYHRGLSCLTAIELKVTEFKPEYLGKMQFYLEALDKQIKKPHENPSIGIIICKTKDEEVVKYALNRNTSPAMVAEYETKLVNKNLLQKKLHEFSQYLELIEEEPTEK
jgi:predicted nuclease of restriction endonuclease-like (RecB) superfamily